MVTGGFNNPGAAPFEMTHVLPSAVRSYRNSCISLKHTLKLCADRTHCVILFLYRQQKTVDNRKMNFSSGLVSEIMMFFADNNPPNEKLPELYVHTGLAVQKELKGLILLS